MFGELDFNPVARQKPDPICYPSPIGVIEIRIENEEVVAVKFVDTPQQISTVNSEIGKKAIAQLQEYFEGKRFDFDLPLSFQGTDFQQKVWSELCRIPYGETISYHELARRVGNEKAYRAAGNANGKNPICLIIPCHRVIQANGNLGGYAYGSEVKGFLLELEKSKM